MPPPRLPLFLAAFLLLLMLVMMGAAEPDADRAALLDFLSWVGGGRGRINWASSPRVCGNWAGVTCSGDGSHVGADGSQEAVEGGGEDRSDWWRPRRPGKLRDAYASGRSDMQLMDQALELYRSHQGHQFLFMHWWKAVADSPKWNSHISNGGPGPKKRTPDLNRNLEPMVRPIGIKKAKKGKGSASELALEVKEQLKNLVDVQANQKEEFEGTKDRQKKLFD
uniref:Leucine-rich repeat-containing N-terminal plant-type domain-containing protein n=1 Tax=Oryza brachyantha TaxID=4533 RepID=J3M5R6_ORYBR